MSSEAQREGYALTKMQHPLLSLRSLSLTLPVIALPKRHLKAQAPYRLLGTKQQRQSTQTLRLFVHLLRGVACVVCIKSSVHQLTVPRVCDIPEVKPQCPQSVAARQITPTVSAVSVISNRCQWRFVLKRSELRWTANTLAAGQKAVQVGTGRDYQNILSQRSRTDPVPRTRPFDSHCWPYLQPVCGEAQASQEREGDQRPGMPVRAQRWESPCPIAWPACVPPAPGTIYGIGRGPLT